MKQSRECSGGPTRADETMKIGLCRLSEPFSHELAGREWNSPIEAELEARRMYQRTLASWAMDVLSLRRRGLDVPRARRLREAA